MLRVRARKWRKLILCSSTACTKVYDNVRVHATKLYVVWFLWAWHLINDCLCTSTAPSLSHSPLSTPSEYRWFVNVPFIKFSVIGIRNSYNDQACFHCPLSEFYRVDRITLVARGDPDRIVKWTPIELWSGSRSNCEVDRIVIQSRWFTTEL